MINALGLTNGVPGEFWFGVSMALGSIVLALFIVFYLTSKKDDLDQIEEKAKDETEKLSDDQLKSSVDKFLNR